MVRLPKEAQQKRRMTMSETIKEKDAKQEKKKVKIEGITLQESRAVNDLLSQLEENKNVYENEIERTQGIIDRINEDIKFIKGLETKLTKGNRDYYKEYREKQLNQFKKSMDEAVNVLNVYKGYVEQIKEFVELFKSKVVTTETERYITHTFETDFYKPLIEFARALVKTTL
jgi:trans-aconitate methyltransferase